MIAAIILAAGESSRMRGRAKPLLRFGGRPLIRVVVDAALEAGCRPVIVVLGDRAEAIRAEIAKLPIEIVTHPDWSEGMGSSIGAGIGHLLPAPREVRGALLLTCDQPRISSAVIGELTDVFDAVEGRRVACEYAGTVGVPALFERSLFRDLLILRGDRGAKRLLLRDPAKLVRVPWAQGAENINTPEDYQALGECGPGDSAL